MQHITYAEQYEYIKREYDEMKDFPIHDIRGKPMGLLLTLEHQIMDLKHEIDKPNRNPRRIEETLEVIHSGLALLYMVRREYAKNYISTIREPILSFATEMERFMGKHDRNKSDSWKEMEIKQLISMLDVEISEWKESLERYADHGNKNELIDIANFCMMLWYRMNYEVNWIVDGVCQKEKICPDSICNLGYACDGCLYNKKEGRE